MAYLFVLYWDFSVCIYSYVLTSVEAEERIFYLFFDIARKIEHKQIKQTTALGKAYWIIETMLSALVCVCFVFIFYHSTFLTSPKPPSHPPHPDIITILMYLLSRAILLESHTHTGWAFALCQTNPFVLLQIATMQTTCTSSSWVGGDWFP